MVMPDVSKNVGSHSLKSVLIQCAKEARDVQVLDRRVISMYSDFR